MTPTASKLGFRVECVDCDLVWSIQGNGIYHPKNGIFWDKEHDMAKHGRQIVIKKKKKDPEKVTVVNL